MSEVVLQDQEIIDLTKQINKDGYVKFEIILPGSNRKVTSESMRGGDIKGRTLIDWCEAIRGQMHADYQESRDKMEQKRQKRIKHEDEEREKALQAAQEAAGGEISEDLDGGIILPGIEQETASEEPKLIIPQSVKQPSTAAGSSHKDNLWTTYGTLLGELERVKAQLRAMGEQV